jgi:hypothetical protein
MGYGPDLPFTGFDIKCQVCGETPRVMYEPEFCGSPQTGCEPASFEIACQRCGSSYDLDDGYVRRERFPSAKEK